jgi:hypothetical protein
MVEPVDARQHKKRLQRLCDGLTPDKIDALLRKWPRRLPHAFTVADRRAGYARTPRETEHVVFSAESPANLSKNAGLSVLDSPLSSFPIETRSGSQPPSHAVPLANLGARRSGVRPCA